MKTGWYVLLDGKEIGPMPAKDIRSGKLGVPFSPPERQTARFYGSARAEAN
jgi:hypothetical protein